MLPKSRRALTIQEIAALARSSLHGSCLGCGGARGGGRGTGRGVCVCLLQARGIGLLGSGGLPGVTKGTIGVPGGTQEEGPKGWG